MGSSNKVLIGLGIICGIGYVGYLNYKINTLSRLLNVAVDDISSNIDVNISDDMLERATQKAVDREVGYVAGRVTRDLGMEIRSRVISAVNTSSDNIKDSVGVEIKRQVKNIDISDMQREVIRQAKEAVAEKFDSKLDGLLEDFNDNLNNVQKIYSSIANSMTK